MPIRITDLRSDEEIADLCDDLYLKLDQTIHQHVVNDAPHFDGSVASDTPAIIIKSGQRLVFDGA